MLKIIRLSLPTRDFVQLKHAIVLRANCNQMSVGYNNSVELLLRKHIFCMPRVCSINRSQKHVVTNSTPLSNSTLKSLNLSTKYDLFFPQRRHFSFQTSVESFARTQSGVFKALSESTPVEYCQKYLLYVHDLTGLPWWASIICSTIFIRAAITLPLALYQQYILAKLENLKLDLHDIVAELKKETAIAVKIYNWDEKTARATYNRSLRKEWDKLIIRNNCHPVKATILLWFQIPLWVSLSISFRNLVYMLPIPDVPAQLTYTELMGGGFGIITNLTLPDTSWIFPVTLGILNLLIIEFQMLAKAPTMERKKLQKFLINTFRVLSVLMVPISATVPSCLVLYWTTSSAYGLVQNLVLVSPKVKRFFKIPETSSEVKQPYKMIISNLKTKLKML